MPALPRRMCLPGLNSDPVEWPRSDAMIDNLNVALQLLVLGMSITFGALFLLWGLMALLTF
jgi:hypothetical protein